VRTISFAFDEKKATQAAEVLLVLNYGIMDYRKLMKLLYLSDRKAILSWNDSITMDHYVCMNNGPVTSCIYDSIKSACVDDGSYWGSRIRTIGYEAVLIDKNPSDGELSEIEIETLQEIIYHFQVSSEEALASYCHSLPELRKAFFPLSFEAILSQKFQGEEFEEAVADMLHISDVQRGNLLLERR